MTGEPLEPLRPHLAEKQRTGEASAENADIVIRALAPVTRRGFDPEKIDAGEQLLAQFATQFAPKDLRRLATKVVEAIDPDGTLPERGAAAGSAVLPDAPHQGRRLCRGVPAHQRLRDETVVVAASAGETPDQQHPHRRGEAGRGTRPAPPRAADARRAQ